MRRLNVALIFLALLAGCLLSPFVLLDSGAQVSSSTARRVRGGNTPPATCKHTNPADVWIDTDAAAGSRLLVCTSANTWTAQGGGTTLTDSASLRSALSDETGTGAAVFANTPTLVTPALGAATATSVTLGADDAYDATSWNGSLAVPTKNAVRDKIESLGGSSGTTEQLVATATINLNSTSVQDLYTVPSGNAFVLTRVVLRNPSTSLAAMPDDVRIRESVGGSAYGTQSVTGLTLTNHFVIFQAGGASGSGRTVAATGKIQAQPIDVLGSAATVTADVWGYILP